MSNQSQDDGETIAPPATPEQAAAAARQRRLEYELVRRYAPSFGITGDNAEKVRAVIAIFHELQRAAEAAR